jgi:archaellum component FlaG (FlaF/FlaG flagellin family)
MDSGAAFLAIFCVIIFITGSVAGALALFVISIHRTGRTSLFEASGQQRGSTARSMPG